MEQNIPCDLYYEHVNKLIKHMMINDKHGSNLTEMSLQRAARSISTLHAIEKKFDDESGIPCTHVEQLHTPPGLMLKISSKLCR